MKKVKLVLLMATSSLVHISQQFEIEKTFLSQAAM